jgi:hypothetical protein
MQIITEYNHTSQEVLTTDEKINGLILDYLKKFKKTDNNTIIKGASQGMSIFRITETSGNNDNIFFLSIDISYSDKDLYLRYNLSSSVIDNETGLSDFTLLREFVYHFSREEELTETILTNAEKALGNVTIHPKTKKAKYVSRLY